MPNANDKYALIAYLTKSVQERATLGKKALQKLVHLTSEVAHVPVGYDFRLYTYGPFSRELAGDVDVLDAMDVLSVLFEPDRNGYVIIPSENTDVIIKKSQEFIESYQRDIDSIVGRFGDRLAKDLELSSMLVFILNNKMVVDLKNDNDVVEKFREIKPHYAENDIRNGLKEIRELLN